MPDSLQSSSKNRLFLGIDGGGSKIGAVLLDHEKRLVAEVVIHGSANYRSAGLSAMLDHLTESVQAVLDASGLSAPVIPDVAVCALAGCNFPEDQKIIGEAVRHSALSSLLGQNVHFTNDAMAALRAGTDAATAIVLIAGTGSNCFGRRADGRMAQAGGLDFLLSDEGSGYDIGSRLLRAVVRAEDGRSEPTLMRSLLYDRLAINDLSALSRIVYKDYSSKFAVASLAPLVSEAAERGDAVARDILTHSVNELVKMVDAVINRLELRDEAVPVVRGGSVFHEHIYVTQRLEEELRRVASRCTLVEPKVSAAIGAAWIASEL
jgi:N-acetylglucosamine kinase-like BadF-type ATPase